MNEGADIPHDAYLQQIWHLIVDYISHPRQDFVYRKWIITTFRHRRRQRLKSRFPLPGSPAAVAVICNYNVIVHMCSIFFARRCYIVTGRKKAVGLVLGSTTAASIGIATTACALNIYVTSKGQAFVEVRQLDLQLNTSVFPAPAEMRFYQTRLFLTIALAVQAGLDVVISSILVAKIERTNLFQ